MPVKGVRLADYLGQGGAFMLIDADPRSGNISWFALLAAPASEPGELPAWLQQQGAQTLIAAGVEAPVERLLVQRGIAIWNGAPGDSLERVARAWAGSRHEA